MLCAVIACGPLPVSMPAVDAGADQEQVIIAAHVSDALRACGQNPRMVSTIGEVVEAVNRLPRPVSIPCVIASLPRPLPVVAAQSFISAQPAFERTSPRIFILEPGLAISVVPVGSGASLLEMGQWVSQTRTIKGELQLPVTGDVAPQTPFERIMYMTNRTSCGSCHRHEEADETIDGGYSSDAYRPVAGAVVPLTTLEAEHQACIDSPDGGDRCDTFHALFDFGRVREAAFNDHVGQLQP